MTHPISLALDSLEWIPIKTMPWIEHYKLYPRLPMATHKKVLQVADKQIIVYLSNTSFGESEDWMVLLDDFIDYLEIDYVLQLFEMEALNG